jgi:hypothetical protein
MLWLKPVKRGMLALRNRAILLRHLARLILKLTQSQIIPNNTLTPVNDKNKHKINILTTLTMLETKLHTPIRSTINLGLLPTEPTTTNASNTLESATILACCKGHQTAIRLTIKHANRTRYIKYGSALLAMFIRKPRDALKSILKTTSPKNKDINDPTPTNLSSITRPNDPITRLITNDPAPITTIIESLETKALSLDNLINPLASFPWLHAIPAGTPPTKNMIIGNITPAIFQEALRQLPNHKAPGPDNIPGILLKNISKAFHKAIYRLFQAMATTGITPPDWLLSNTIFLYKKNDPYNLGNYRPITLANALYKLLASCLTILAMDYVDAHKINSPEQEGFRAGRSCSRAITHLSLCVEGAHTHDKDILIAYLDFTQAFPSADHTQLARTLRFLGIPEDFIFTVTNLYTHHVPSSPRTHSPR